MKHGSLFSGIGGFDLASEWMGWENVFHCEIAEFPRKILHYYWPNSISYENIKETDFTIHRGGIDILTGGFPCQPFSMAGKRKGTEDERHLWPEMLRAIREIQPRWIVGENVFGLVNWDAGLVFEQVQSDLEAEGYEVQAFILPAAAVDAPHRRDRVWFVAYRNCNRRPNGYIGESSGKSKKRGKFNVNNSDGSLGPTPNPDSNGLNQRNGNYEEQSSEGRVDAQRNSESSNVNGDASDTNNWGGSNDTIQTRRQKSNELYDTPQNATDTENTRPKRKCFCGQRQIQSNGCCFENVSNTNNKRLQRWKNTKDNATKERTWKQCNNPARLFRTDFENFPTQSPICSGDDGLPTELDGITFSKWRNESIKGYGNAIVPQVVLQIFKAIEEYESQR